MRSRSRGRRTGAVVSIVVALAAVMALGPSTAAGATVTSAWRAKIGTAGANGVATIQGYATGSGAIILKLTRLRPATYLPVTLSRGTCSSVGAVLIRFPTIHSTSTGTAARTSSLTAAQVTLIGNATKGTGKIALRVGSATTGGIKCGVFATLAIPPVVTATITVGLYPLDVAVTPTAVWVTNTVSDSVSKIDPATNKVLTTLNLGPVGSGMAQSVVASEGAVWVSNAGFDSATKAFTAGNVLRIDATTGQTIATVPVGRNNVDMAASPGAIWVTNYDDGTVSRIDTTTNRVAATITLAAGVAGIAYGEGGVWVTNEKTGTVSRIDPATNTVTATIASAGSPEGVAVAFGAVWVADLATGDTNGVLSRIDPATNQVVRTTTVGSGPIFVSPGGGYLWLSMAGEPTVVQVNPVTGAVQSRIAVGGPSIGIGSSDHAVWVVHFAASGSDPLSAVPGTVTRITY